MVFFEDYLKAIAAQITDEEKHEREFNSVKLDAEWRSNSETNEWHPTTEKMTQTEINQANGFYRWTKFRKKVAQ